MRVQSGMKSSRSRDNPELETKCVLKGVEKEGGEKRGRRQRKYSTLADLDAHGGGGPGTALLIPAVTCISR